MLSKLGYIKRNTKMFSSANCCCVLYLALVHSNLEYWVVVRHSNLGQLKKNVLTTLLLKTNHPHHDYSHYTKDSNPIFSSRSDVDFHFITSILNGPLDATDLLSSININVPAYFSINHFLFYVSSNYTSYTTISLRTEYLVTLILLILIIKQSFVALQATSLLN